MLVSAAIPSGVIQVPSRPLVLPLALLLAPLASAQQACPPVLAPVVDSSKILFTPAQEVELGDLIKDQFDADFHVIQDPAVTAYLDRVGRQVVRHLPETGLRFEFLLYDLPEIQAFSAPGGRIYVSRKLVAFLKNDDELAGLLGHELGHLVARQQALELSLAFRDVLNLKSLSDSDDLADLYNQFLESIRTKKRHSSSSPNEDKGQSVADRIGVQAVARAGFSPQAFPAFLDRLMQTKGKTGNWFSDMFGATRPDSRRLREALQDVASLPAPCIESASPALSADFQQWQSAVLHYTGIGHAERLPGLISRQTLNNPLRGDIEHFRFSPEGKYLLAQDEGGLYVLTRDPLGFLFRIDSPDAQPGQFTPDSRQIVFFNSQLRVETWDIDRREQVRLDDIPALHGCRESALSPDARFFACFDNALSLSLFDVASGEIIYQQDHFFEFDDNFSFLGGFYKLIYFLSHPEVVVLRFSPDIRYFAASSRTGESVVFDLAARKKISVPGSVHTAMAYAFTFLGPDRIAGVDQFSPQKSPLVEFPAGKVLDRLPLGGGSLVAATNPKFILMRPVTEFPVGAYDVDAKKIVFVNRNSAMDIWGDQAVGERLNGEIGFYKTGDTKAFAIAQLPLGNLASLRSFVASPDLKFMAVSNHTRGGIWNLDTNTRVFHVRAFQSAFFTPSSTFFLDFPSFEKEGRQMVVASPVTAQSKARPVDKDDDITFFGDVLFRIEHNDKNRSARRNFTVNALDIVDQKPLWSLNFPKQGPNLSGSPSSGIVVLSWLGGSDGLHAEVERSPRLQALWDKGKPKAGDYLLEALDTRKGTVLGGAILRTGNWSFAPETVAAMGDWLVVADNRNRVLLFSIATGEQKARWFGYRPQLSRNGQRLSLANGRGHLVVYDLQTLKPLEDLYFASPVSAQFLSADGAKLLVLTNDQNTFQFQLSQNAATSAPSPASH